MFSVDVNSIIKFSDNISKLITRYDKLLPTNYFYNYYYFSFIAEKQLNTKIIW